MGLIVQKFLAVIRPEPPQLRTSIEIRIAGSLRFDLPVILID